MAATTGPFIYISFIIISGFDLTEYTLVAIQKVEKHNNKRIENAVLNVIKILYIYRSTDPISVESHN